MRPTTTWRAYLTLIVVYLVVFGPSMAQVLAEGIGSGRPAPQPETLWADAALTWANYLLLVPVALAILAYAAWRRRSQDHHVRIRDLGITPTWTRTPDPAEKARWRIQGMWVFTLALTAYLAATLTMGLLALLFPHAMGGLAVETLNEALRTATTYGPALVISAVVEETLLVGVLVTVLAAARRPTPEILTIAALAKVSYHLYYGWPVLLALGPCALVVAWLYLRTNRLTPIIAAHATHNLTTMGLQLLALHQLQTLT